MTAQHPLHSLPKADQEARVAAAVRDLYEYVNLHHYGRDVEDFERTIIALGLLGRCRTCHEDIPIDELDRPCPECENDPRREPQ